MPTSRSQVLAAVSLLFVAAFAAACGGSVDSGGQGTGGAGGSGGGCDYLGKSYAPGDSFPAGDGCNSCQCGPDGQVGCTLMYCSGSCEYSGKLYAPGDTFPASDGCNSCQCMDGGQVLCSSTPCVDGCEYNGLWHAPGESFPAGDGCNTCYCDQSGMALCTGAYCAPVCKYAGKEYGVGESFAALDGCNKCQCTAQGVSCTELACACDPAKEWWHKYVSTSPQQCQVIDYLCEPNTKAFSNSCGCGCEQDLACPEYFDCMPPSPCDTQKIKEQCPYSGIAW